MLSLSGAPAPPLPQGSYALISASSSASSLRFSSLSTLLCAARSSIYSQGTQTNSLISWKSSRSILKLFFMSYKCKPSVHEDTPTFDYVIKKYCLICNKDTPLSEYVIAHLLSELLFIAESICLCVMCRKR